MQNFNNPIYIVDFEDSFTHNISEVLMAQGVYSKVIEKNLFFNKIDHKCNSSFFYDKSNRYGVILGPGPGHPSKYQDYIGLINKLMRYENVFVMGICLGHQLIWYGRGEQITERLNPIHGKVFRFMPPNWDIFGPLLKKNLSISVQQYNSLCLRKSLMKNKQNDDQLFSVHDEVLMSKGDRYFTTQFHPESIGTSFQSLFFGPIIKFLYN